MERISILLEIKLSTMSFEKEEIVQVEVNNEKMEGKVIDRYIQKTELDYEGTALLADASEENPVYLVELDNGKVEMVSEGALEKK